GGRVREPSTRVRIPAAWGRPSDAKRNGRATIAAAEVGRERANKTRRRIGIVPTEAGRERANRNRRGAPTVPAGARPDQATGDGPAEVAEAIAGVVARAAKLDTVQAVGSRKLLQSVGQLDLADRARLGRLEVSPDHRGKDVAAHDRPSARRSAGLRLLDHVANA